MKGRLALKFGFKAIIWALAALLAAAVGCALLHKAKPKEAAGLQPKDAAEVHSDRQAGPGAAAGDLEQRTSELGGFLRRAAAGELQDSENISSFMYMWPVLPQLMVLENKCRRQNDYQAVNLPYAEERQIFNYLFNTDSEMLGEHYLQLARTLCSERLSRQGAAMFRDGRELTDSVCCPISNAPYEIKDLGLSCREHALVCQRKDLHVENDPSELYRQLAMGYYNHKRVHQLDSVILSDEPCGVKPGERVAEIGCGVGCYTWSLAAGVGHSGKVIAMDIDGEVLKFIDYAAENTHNKNVETLLVTVSDPKLAPASVDRIYMIDILNVMIGRYVHDGMPMKDGTEEYLRKLAESLKSGGRLVVVDYYPVDARPHLSRRQTVDFMRTLGLKEEDERDAPTTDKMYVLTFGKKLNHD